jgi:hypothetical protein
MHRQSKHRVVDEEEDDDEVVELMAADKLDFKVRIRENKRSIKAGIVNVSEEVIIKVQAKKYKYEDKAFYQLINSFYQEAMNKFVGVPKIITNLLQSIACSRSFLLALYNGSRI